MSILLGTSVGKVYLYNLSKGKVTCKRGEASAHTNVVGLDWMEEKGDLVLSNLDDELRTIGEKVVPQHAVGFLQVGRSFLVGDSDGNIKTVPYDFDKIELMYSLSQASDLLKDTKLNTLTQLRLDPYSGAKVVCLHIEKQAIAWEGKNVPADELQLKVPMLDNDCTFGDQGNTITTATAFGKLRMHDFREAKKRPIKDIKLDKQPLTRILQRAADGKLLVSSNVGEVFYVDPKTNYSVVKKFNNAHGTITDMDLNQSQTQFCTVSLDRHLRIYSLETNALLREEFVFQKLEKCRFSKDEFDFDNHEIEAEDEEEEEPETDHMTTLTSKSNAPELFRDKLAKAGGKLNHNLIKLKYEKRHIAPTLEKRPAPSA